MLGVDDPINLEANYLNRKSFQSDILSIFAELFEIEIIVDENGWGTSHRNNAIVERSLYSQNTLVFHLLCLSNEVF